MKRAVVVEGPRATRSRSARWSTCACRSTTAPWTARKPPGSWCREGAAGTMGRRCLRTSHLPPGSGACAAGSCPTGTRSRSRRSWRRYRQAGRVPDVLLLLEHPPVYTRGRRSTPGELPMGEEWYRAQGIDVVETDRGGRVTYHGPGQLVGYPIMSLRPYRDDVHAVHPPDGVGDHRLARRRGHRGGADRGADRRVDARAAQDRIDRRPRQPRRHDARLRDQRQQRPPAVRVDRAVRDRQLPDDVRHARAGTRSSTWIASWTSSQREFGVAYGRLPAEMDELIVAARGGRVSTERVHVTRSRAKPGGAAQSDADVIPFRSRKPPWLKVKAPGGPSYRRIERADAPRRCTRSARRRTARTSASAGSAAPRPS